MNGSAVRQELARHFLEVIPVLLHCVGSELRAGGERNEPVTLAQVRVMGALRFHSRSLGELAAVYRVSPATMSRLISTLVRRGWVAREDDPNDRRQVVLYLTPKGEMVWKMLAERSIEHLSAILGQLTPNELDALKQALAGLARIAKAGVARERCD